MTISNKSSRIIFLDFLRIFAFTSVLIGHKFYDQLLAFSNNDAMHATPRLLIKSLLPLFLGGGAGVVVFFLISGYIILHVLQVEQTSNFLIKRIFRIYPLYIFAVLSQTLISMVVDNASINLKYLIPQLLLIGDFFNTPHALNGVEWTLRIEIMFYLYLGCLSFFQLINQYKQVLPWLFLLTITLLANLPAMPNNLWNVGCVNIYAPFLFLGSLFWMYEHKKVSTSFMAFFIFILFIQYWNLIATLHPEWRNMHFSILAVGLFAIAWLLRDKITFSKPIFFISELTYAVYLFHNWCFDYFKKIFISAGIIHPSFYALVGLFTISALAVKFIEKPAIKIGKIIADRMKGYSKIKGIMIV